MIARNKTDILRHIKTHTVHSDDDRSAVSVLETFLRSDGKINSNFSTNDKWPNTDGTFEFVENIIESRRPKQNFIVQIKGTKNYNDNQGIVKYQLNSLGFPALICDEVTLDPGILFVVLNPKDRGRERVFWKYMSDDFLAEIDFSNDSKVIQFSADDELNNTTESINSFCKKINRISNHHSFVKKIDNTNYTKNQIFKIIKQCNQELTECIDNGEVLNLSRDDLSKRLLRYLDDLCKSTILLNTVGLGFESPDLRLGLEKSLMKRETKYLAVFLKGLRYISGRIPEDGQSERLMLKYYNFLWQIRKNLKEDFNIDVLKNLEKFPLNIDKIDSDYYENISRAIESVKSSLNPLGTSRFYVVKRLPFFVGTERYYEITLQLANMYSTKYNRITVYSKDSLDTPYSIQISYENSSINLWNIESNIKVVKKWEVSIEPTCLNKLAKVLNKNLRITKNHGEYKSLMDFLTRSGMSLLDLIDLSPEQFDDSLNKIYANVNTSYYKEILIDIHKMYGINSEAVGRYTLRYLLIHLREEVIRGVLPENNPHSKSLSSPLNLTSKCYPFEQNPYVANLVGRKTNMINVLSDIQQITGIDIYKKYRPFIKIKNQINKTGELYHLEDSVKEKEQIDVFNKSLGQYQRNQGHMIAYENDYVTIQSFEFKTIDLLERLLSFSKHGNGGQKQLNSKYLKELKEKIDDQQKVDALSRIFVDSQVALIYGAAGTGKTKLINYISSMMSNMRKLFLTKTHTTLQNLKRRIDNPGQNADFVSIDRFTKKVTPENYDLIFIDECSIIDNDIMLQFMKKITDDTFLVLAGDIFQIESIKFGNWFTYAKDILNTNGSSFELVNTWRTKDETLIDLWDSVRNKSQIITEKLAIDGCFSEDIGENIFEKTEEDEVVLCLNYDGKFGLNNINQIFQNSNEGEIVYWEDWGYKIGDPILFNDTKRFNLLYNNLKGKIFDILKCEKHIDFVLDVNLLLTEADCNKDNIEFVQIFDEVTRIKFRVNLYEDSDELDEVNKVTTVVPFQIAYALSIHKAQGLEFDSVKIVIPSSNSEKITHGIFYTAITRAKKKLKIYWSSESMQSVISSFYKENLEHTSLRIIQSKLKND